MTKEKIIKVFIYRILKITMVTKNATKTNEYLSIHRSLNEKNVIEKEEINRSCVIISRIFSKDRIMTGVKNLILLKFKSNKGGFRLLKKIS